MSLRSFRDGDDSALLDIHTRAIRAVADHFYSPAERESWAFGLTADRYALSRAQGETFAVVVGDDDVPCGFCSWNNAQIIGLYVAPDCQGRGLGSALLGHGEAALRALQVSVSRIHASLSAVAFYQSHGYRITGHTNNPSRGGLPMAAVLLEKPLAP